MQTERKIAEIRESIDELIEKGKKKTLKYEELIARREARVKRLMQLDEARSWVLMNFARIFAVNREIIAPFNRARLLSIIPNEYGFSVNKDAKFTDFVQSKILSQFNSLFISYLDPSKTCDAYNLFTLFQEPNE